MTRALGGVRARALCWPRGPRPHAGLRPSARRRGRGARRPGPPRTPPPTAAPPPVGGCVLPAKLLLCRDAFIPRPAPESREGRKSDGPAAGVSARPAPSLGTKRRPRTWLARRPPGAFETRAAGNARRRRPGHAGRRKARSACRRRFEAGPASLLTLRRRRPRNGASPAACRWLPGASAGSPGTQGKPSPFACLLSPRPLPGSLIPVTAGLGWLHPELRGQRFGPGNCLQTAAPCAHNNL